MRDFARYGTDGGLNSEGKSKQSRLIRRCFTAPQRLKPVQMAYLNRSAEALRHPYAKARIVRKGTNCPPNDVPTPRCDLLFYSKNLIGQGCLPFYSAARVESCDLEGYDCPGKEVRASALCLRAGGRREILQPVLQRGWIRRSGNRL